LSAVATHDLLALFVVMLLFQVPVKNAGSNLTVKQLQLVLKANLAALSVEQGI